MSMDTIFTRDTLISAVINGFAALLAVRYLIPSEAAVGLLSQHSLTVALVMGVVSVMVDQIYPRINDFISTYGA